jgi:hypothetical protein
MWSPSSRLRQFVGEDAQHLKDETEAVRKAESTLAPDRADVVEARKRDAEEAERRLVKSSRLLSLIEDRTEGIGFEDVELTADAGDLSFTCYTMARHVAANRLTDALEFLPAGKVAEDWIEAVAWGVKHHRELEPEAVAV